MKRCSVCKSDKPLDDFCADRSRSDGRFPYCKECYKVKRAKYSESAEAIGMCTNCLVRRSERGIVCDFCKETHKIYVQKKKQLGICIDCTKPAAKNRHFCEQCMEKRRRYSRLHPKSRSDMAEWKKKRRAELDGICQICSSREMTDGKLTCAQCRELCRIRMAAYCERNKNHARNPPSVGADSGSVSDAEQRREA